MNYRVIISFILMTAKIICCLIRYFVELLISGETIIMTDYHCINCYPFLLFVKETDFLNFIDLQVNSILSLVIPV